MKKIEVTIIFLLIIFTAMPAIAESPAFPGSGDRIELFLMRHLDMRDNQEIMDFINTYGISDFQEIDPPGTDKFPPAYRYIYIIPKENCSKKLLFLEKDGEIAWVRQIGMNETIPIKETSPLDDFFYRYPTAESNETISSFIEAYAPQKWKKTQINRNSSLVYLICENNTFLELMFQEKNGSIVQVKTFNESKVAVNKKKALEIAANETNILKAPENVLVMFQDSETFWAVTYMIRSTATTVFIDTENGKLYYSIPEAEEKSGTAFSEISDVFIGGLILAVILGLAWTLPHIRSKK